MSVCVAGRFKPLWPFAPRNHETASEGLKTLSGSPQRAVSLSLLHRIGLFRSLLSRGFGDGQSGTKSEYTKQPPVSKHLFSTSQ
jgi:hypothetical protein